MTAYYQTQAEAFVAATRVVDMSALRGRFLAALPVRAAGPQRILDAGSGSGRDARAFRALGHAVSAFDAAPAMVAATESHAGVPARLMRFETFAWEHPFEGIWACAALLHVARADLPGALARLVAHLVPGGVLYLSFKQGRGTRVRDGRRFTDMTAGGLAALLEGSARLGPAEVWLSPDARPARAQETWVNALVTAR